jgi:putative hemolysin
VNAILGSIALVAVFITVGGVFAAAEIALVSLREGQVRGLAERSRRGRRVAALAANPNRFLAAVQIGVTLAGFMSAAFGEATLSVRLEPVLREWGLTAGSNIVATVIVTLIISYFALVFGELTPKRLGLQRAEGIALAMAPFVDRLARISRPVIWLLSKSTDVVVRLLGGDPTASREAITEEELRGLVAAHESLSRDERQLIDEVFAAGEKQLREVMVPRTEVQFLAASMPVSEALAAAQELPHSRYPVVRDNQDDVIGFVHVRDLVTARATHGCLIADISREVKRLPASKSLLPALSEMRREHHHLAVVVDEYGGTAGIVTLEDLIEEVIGDIRDEYDEEEAPDRLLRSGELEVDGLLNLDEFADRTGVRLPDGPYETVAGYVMAHLGHLPEVGEAVEVAAAEIDPEADDEDAEIEAPVRLSVVALDGRRIARIRVSRIQPAGGEPAGGEPALAAEEPPQPADVAPVRG